MAKNILSNLNLGGNELQNAVIQVLAAAPQTGKIGQVYVNSTDHLLYVHNGTSWVAVGAVISVNSKVGVVTLTQDDVGDGTTYKRTHNDLTDALVNVINGALPKSGGTMTGDIAMGSNGITGLPTPTNNADAATKKYVDDAISGLGSVFTFKGSKASTSELPLSGNKQGDVWLVTSDNSEYVWTISSASGTIDNWEKLGVVVDLSGYATLVSPAFTGTPTAPTAAAGTNTTQIATTAFVQGVAIKTATGTIDTNSTTATVNFTGTLVNAYAIMSGNMVILDIAPGSSYVVFSVASAPSSAITCTVVYV